MILLCFQKVIVLLKYLIYVLVSGFNSLTDNKWVKSSQSKDDYMLAHYITLLMLSHSKLLHLGFCPSKEAAAQNKCLTPLVCCITSWNMLPQ